MTSDGTVVPLASGRARVGGVVIDRAGGVVCSGRDGLWLVDAGGQGRSIAATIAGAPLRNVNELEADADGALYGGQVDFDAFDAGTSPRPGAVFRLDPDGRASRLLDVAIPNGMAFSADGGTFFLSQTGEGVFAYDVRRDRTLGGRRLLAAMPDSDGIALDEAGGFWVARCQSSLIAYHDATGALVRQIETLFAHAASVALGGDDLTDLYVVGGDRRDRRNGGVARLRGVETPGLRPHRSATGSLA